MNFRILLLPLLFIGLSGFGCQENGGEPTNQETEVDFASATNAIRVDFDQAVTQGNAAAIAALYTADAKSYRPDGTTGNGTEEITTSYQGMFDLGINDVTLTPMETLEAGDWGWEIGGYTYTGQSAEGDTLTFEGEYTVLLTKADGTWKMHRVVAFATRDPSSNEAMMASSDDMPMAEESQGEVLEDYQVVGNQFAMAVAEADASAATAVYAADAILYGPDGSKTSGAEAITTRYQNMIDTGLKDVATRPVETVHQGDVAWQFGRSSYTIETAEGTPLMMKGEYASLLIREEGTWKVLRAVAFAPRHAPSEETTDDAM